LDKNEADHQIEAEFVPTEVKRKPKGKHQMKTFFSGQNNDSAFSYSI
jgi:hypothetical protein